MVVARRGPARWKWMSAPLLAVASFAWLAPSPAMAQEPDSAAALLKVSVTVRDALSNEAVAGAVVELSGLSGRHVTDDDGTATFEVPAGWYRLAVRKSGYATIDGDFPDFAGDRDHSHDAPGRPRMR